MAEPIDTKTQTSATVQTAPDKQTKTTEVTEVVTSVPDSAKAVKPVHIDGGLYAAIGVLTALLVALDSDGAVKHVGPDLLWWMQTITESINGGLLALKMFRSTAYADSKG